MSSSTEDRTQPRMRLYYAIMAGGFAASLAALILLNFAAFGMIAMASIIVVILAAVRLGIAGSQIVVEEPPRPPFNWREFAAWAMVPVLISASLAALSWMPDGWWERFHLVTMLSSLCMLSFIGSIEILRALRGRPNERLKPRMIRLGAGSLILGLAGAGGFALVRGNFDSSFVPFPLYLAWALVLSIGPVIQRLAPTPPAPSPPGAE
ncbi:hypothetical protein [Maricaulis salignorans]|uniref:hypothetical protein n=1 Tax=Maricaulis salignorans TaxID=144026 RepID=UPI003A8FCCC2